MTEVELQDALTNPRLQRTIKRLGVKTYDEFVDFIYDDLRIIIDRLESSVNYSEKPSEDELTARIVDMFYFNDYDVIQDGNNRGHADVTIKKGHFKWMAEAKLYTNYVKLFGGTTQLVCRYMSGASDQTKGALIIYFGGKDMLKTMETWQDKLQYNCDKSPHKDEIGLKSIGKIPSGKLHFESIHNHSNSGLETTIRHVPVLLRYKPIDADL